MIWNCNFQSRIQIKIKKSYLLFEESTIFKFPTFPEKKWMLKYIGNNITHTKRQTNFFFIIEIVLVFGKKCKEDVLLPLSFFVAPIDHPYSTFLLELSCEETEFLMPCNPKLYNPSTIKTVIKLLILMLYCCC